MASGIVRAALDSFTTKSTIPRSSKRNMEAISNVNDFLGKIGKEIKEKI